MKITDKVEWVLFNCPETPYFICKKAGMDISNFYKTQRKERSYELLTLKTVQKIEDFYDEYTKSSRTRKDN